MNNENKRISAILGAGVNLAFQLRTMPSTSNITQAVVNASYSVLNYPDFSQEQSSLVHDIYHTICQRYTLDALDPNRSYGIVHFEVIYDVLEELYSFDKYWRVNRFRNPKEIPPFAYLTHCDIKYKSHHISQVLRQYIEIIMGIVNEYDCEYDKNKDTVERWYKDFWSLVPLKWDVFTFNYDTTIEKSLPSYEDGFEPIKGYPFKQMNPLRLLKSEDHTINHLHGCILYGENNQSADDRNISNIYDYSSKDWYCWPDYQTQRSYASDQHNQAGDTIFRSPIITGLHKTDKIVNMPFDIYRYNLNRELMANNAILIAGYSFGDLYVNYEIERMRLYHGDKLRVVLIDCWGDLKKINKRNEIETLCKYLADFPYKNHDLFEFLCKVMEIAEIDCHIFSEKWKYFQPNVSENGRLMLFIGGIKTAFQFRNEIYQFLQS